MQGGELQSEGSAWPPNTVTLHKIPKEAGEWSTHGPGDEHHSVLNWA